MLHRRAVLIAASAALAGPAAGAESFEGLVAAVKAEARRAGIRDATLTAAFAGVGPNQKVIDADRRQPEFTLTWPEYRARVLPPARLQAARENYAREQALLSRVEAQYGVDRATLLGIWGIESAFGVNKGNYRLVEALATLAWEGRRASYFRKELLNGLRILDAGDVPPAKATSGYAGAMGQPQFMPSSYLQYAVDFDGDGRRDIWDSKAGRVRLDWQLPGAQRLAARRAVGPAGAGAGGSAAGSRRAGQQAAAGRVDAAGRPARRRRAVHPDRADGRAAAAGRGGTGRGLHVLRQLQRDPPLQSVRLLRPGRWPAGRRRRVNALVAATLALAAALAACTQRLPPHPAHYVVGSGYQLAGTWFYPHEDFHYGATGLASILPPRTGVTADGEAIDPAALIAAHQTLQLPAIVRVTNLETGLQLALRVNDRGPDTPNRLIGVSSRAAELLGMTPGGIARVRVEVEEAPSLALRDQLAGAPQLAMQAAPRSAVTAETLPPPPGIQQSTRGRSARPAPAATAVSAGEAVTVPDRLPEQVQRVPASPGALVVQAGTFGQAAYAHRAIARLPRLAARVEPMRSGRTERYVVRLGPFATVAAADTALDQALRAGLTDARIVVE